MDPGKNSSFNFKRDEIILDQTESSGPDNIPSRILREFAHELAELITRIFNRSIASGVVPEI